MTLPSYYSTGTASVANGATSVTGTGTGWRGVVYGGGLLHDPAQRIVARIAQDAAANDNLVLANPWPGTTLSDAGYEILFTPDAVRGSERTRRLLERLSVVEANGRGLFYLFSTTTTDADPGAGLLRFNHATIASATAAYLDNLDANGAAVQTILDTWDESGASGGRGQLWVRSVATPSTFHSFMVTGSVVDGTGYRKLTLTYVGGSGTLNADDELMVDFVPVGAAGSNGTNGTNGTNGAGITPASSAGPAQLDLAEDTDNGTNKVSLKAPASIASDKVQTLQDVTGTVALVADVAAASGFRNRLINGNGAINQRVATSQADDTYAWDRHYVLTQTAAIGTTTVSDVADGLPSMMRLTQSQVSAQRMGAAQIIESANCKDLRGQAVTLLGKLRCSSSQAIRYAILEWTGTADAPVSDIVNSWTNGTFTAGQFFNSTTLTVTQVGTITPSAATVTDFLLTTTLGSSVNNVIVMIWTEGTAAQSVTLDVAWEFVKGNQTGQIYPLEVRSRGQELSLCQRYEYRVKAVGIFNGDLGLGYVLNSTSARITMGALPVQMRATPTVAFGTAVSDFTILDAGANRVVTAISVLSNGPQRTAFTYTVGGGGMTAGQGCMAGDSGNGTSYINFDAEL